MTRNSARLVYDGRLLYTLPERHIMAYLLFTVIIKKTREQNAMLLLNLAWDVT